MSLQEHIPNLKNIGLTLLGTLITLTLPLTLATQALADGGMMSALNNSSAEVKVQCANGEKTVLSKGEGANCTDRSGLNQFIVVKGIPFFPSKDPAISNRIHVDEKGNVAREK